MLYCDGGVKVANGEAAEIHTVSGNVEERRATVSFGGGFWNTAHGTRLLRVARWCDAAG